MKKLKFNYVMIVGQSSTALFLDEELFFFNLLFNHYYDKFHSEYEAWFYTILMHSLVSDWD